MGNVAQQIAKQIGNKALYMIGARQLVANENYLRFRIGRNSKGVNMIKITLEPSDTYKMEFLSVRGMSVKTKAEQTGVFVDMLHGMIEEHTGLYTSL